MQLPVFGRSRRGLPGVAIVLLAFLISGTGGLALAAPRKGPKCAPGVVVATLSQAAKVLPCSKQVCGCVSKKSAPLFGMCEIFCDLQQTCPCILSRTPCLDRTGKPDSAICSPNRVKRNGLPDCSGT
jgi:hypothetical protein